jgi:hypothetical protein
LPTRFGQAAVVHLLKQLAVHRNPAGAR